MPESVRPVHFQAIKEYPEKLSELFALVFAVEGTGRFQNQNPSWQGTHLKISLKLTLL